MLPLIWFQLQCHETSSGWYVGVYLECQTNWDTALQRRMPLTNSLAPPDLSKQIIGLPKDAVSSIASGKGSSLEVRTNRSKIEKYLIFLIMFL